MKKYHVSSLNRPAVIRVETILKQFKFDWKLYPERRLTIIRPYYQIRDEWGGEVFATYSEDEFLKKIDAIDESLNYNDYQFYVQDDIETNDGSFMGLKNQRPYSFTD